MTDHDPGDEDDGELEAACLELICLELIELASARCGLDTSPAALRDRLGLPPTGIAWADLPTEEQKRLLASANRYIDDLFWHQGEPRLS